MNKKMILFTVLIAATPVLRVAASVGAMYCDIKNIVEDKITGKNDYERLTNVQDTLSQVKTYKIHLGASIIGRHSKVDYDKIAGLALGVLS